MEDDYTVEKLMVDTRDIDAFMLKRYSTIFRLQSEGWFTVFLDKMTPETSNWLAENANPHVDYDSHAIVGDNFTMSVFVFKDDKIAALFKTLFK